MGGVVAIRKKNYTQIGVYFVKEEFRHSGIGSKLFKEASKGSVDIVFNASKPMHLSVVFIYCSQFNWRCSQDKEVVKLLDLMHLIFIFLVFVNVSCLTSAYNLVHHLLPTVAAFGLSECDGRRFLHVKIDCPDGFVRLLVSIFALVFIIIIIYYMVEPCERRARSNLRLHI